MAYLKKATGVLLIELGREKVHLRYRQPTVDEMLSALAMKYQSADPEDLKDPERQAENILRANLELGFNCLEGLISGELIIDSGRGPEPLSSEPGQEGYRQDWKESVRNLFPALLVALGQHLSDLPTRIEELKKNRPGHPGNGAGAGSDMQALPGKAKPLRTLDMCKLHGGHAGENLAGHTLASHASPLAKGRVSCGKKSTRIPRLDQTGNHRDDPGTA
jgi:hypothetical protein